MEIIFCNKFCPPPRTLIVHLVRLPNSSPAEDPVLTEKSLLLSAITEHRATLPALHLEATREERYSQLHIKFTHTSQDATDVSI